MIGIEGRERNKYEGREKEGAEIEIGKEMKELRVDKYRKEELKDERNGRKGGKED